MDFRSKHDQSLSDANAIIHNAPATPCVYCGKPSSRHYEDLNRIPGVIIYTCKVKQAKGVPCIPCKQAKDLSQ